MRRVSLTDVGLLLIRGMVAVVFVYHGSQKLFGAFGGPGLEGFAGMLGKMGLPMPHVQAVLAGSAEFLGGLALGLGLATRLAALPMVATMLVAAFMVHGQAFGAQHNGMEYPLTLALVLAGLVLTGPGVLSVDAVVPKLATVGKKGVEV